MHLSRYISFFWRFNNSRACLLLFSENKNSSKLNSETCFVIFPGQSGLGKSTLVNTLFKSKVSRKSCTPEYEEKIPKTVKLHKISHGWSTLSHKHRHAHIHTQTHLIAETTFIRFLICFTVALGWQHIHSENISVFTAAEIYDVTDTCSLQAKAFYIKRLNFSKSFWKKFCHKVVFFFFTAACFNWR